MILKTCGVIRQRKKVDPKTEERFTKVMGFNSLLKNTTCKDLMNFFFEKYSLIISKLSIERSLMIYHEYNNIFAKEPRTTITQEPEFRKLFATLKDSSKDHKNYEAARTFRIRLCHLFG